MEARRNESEEKLDFDGSDEEAEKEEKGEKSPGDTRPEVEQFHIGENKGGKRQMQSCITCKFFMQDRCSKGENFKYRHPDKSEQTADSNAPRDGDWRCSKCARVVWSWK